jgi:hypothetical protein
MRAPRILLIKADDATHLGLRRRLRRRGCEVFDAATAREAEAMAACLEPALVVDEAPLPSPRPPRAYHEVIAAVEILAGPLAHRRPRRSHGLARHVRRASRAGGGERGRRAPWS